MKFLDRTLATPEANLALDEALLDGCESGENSDEVLRVWEPRRYFVVLGYSNKIRREVNLEACLKQKIPVLRRTSGGGTVLQGPGCLNFSLILNLKRWSPAPGITQSNRFIMERHRAAVESLAGRRVTVQGITDLTLGPLKFSGNAQRRNRRFILFHGTFLLHFDIALIGRILPMPSRQPAYRKNRPHENFLTNLPVKAKQLKDSLRTCWSAEALFNNGGIPPGDIERLVKKKYACEAWNGKF